MTVYFTSLLNTVGIDALKLMLFNTTVVATYFALKFLTNIDIEDFGPLGEYGIVLFVVLCNIAFVMYDIAISRISLVYFSRLRKNINFFLK